MSNRHLSSPSNVIDLAIAKEKNNFFKAQNDMPSYKIVFD